MKNTERTVVRLAPDRCTQYRISVVPSADELADWCHPRTSTQTRLEEIAWTSDCARPEGVKSERAGHLGIGRQTERQGMVA